jgi:hypothetical protein
MPGSRDAIHLQAERFSKDKVALKAGDRYVSAEKSGHFSLQKWCREWELYVPVRADEVVMSTDGAAVGISPLPRRYAIPKIIHQVYTVNSPLPADIVKNIKDIQELNADWKIRLWSDKEAMDFIYDCFGFDILKRYLRINPRYGAARADLFRYLCIYKLGGVYLDVKSGCATALDGFIRPADQYLLSQWDRVRGAEYYLFGNHPELRHISGGEFQQWHIIAAPGHPFLEQVINDVLGNIDRYDERFDGVGRRATLRTTGPITYTLSIRKLIDITEHRVFDFREAGLVYRKIENYEGLFDRVYSAQATPLVL